MALIDIKLFSTVLLTNTDVRVIIPTPDEPFHPDDTPYYRDGFQFQVLYLLHGAFGDCTVWSRNTGIERYAQEHRLAVVCASVSNSLYLDMFHGPRAMTYMLDELPAFIEHTFPVCRKRENRFIAGLSMGGYGAFRLALERPEAFACAISLSGGLDIAGLHQVSSGPVVSPFCPEAVWGKDFEEQCKNDDLFLLMKKRKEEGARLPRFYQACGTEDFVYPMNAEAREKMKELSVDLTYRESPGEHNWDYWDPEIRLALNWLPLKNALTAEE